MVIRIKSKRYPLLLPSLETLCLVAGPAPLWCGGTSSLVALAGGWVNKMSLRVVCGNTERTARNPEHSHTRARACIVTQAGRRARAHPGHNLAGEGRWRQARCGVFALGACLRADINIARTRTRACARAHTHTHTNSGQDLGNGLWSMLSELLPRAHSLMVSFSSFSRSLFHSSPSSF